MTDLLTAAQMRAIETAAIESGAVTGLDLMERAGRGVVEAVFEEWPDLAQAPHRAVVLCGPGNNGGDGFVVARVLKEWGWEVEVFLYGNRDALPPDAKANLERWAEIGEVRALIDLDEGHGWCCDVVIDGIFGTGLRRAPTELQGLIQDLTAHMRDQPFDPKTKGGGPAVVAIDLPSGLCSDSGRALTVEETGMPCSASAHLTVSFHALKSGHHLANGPAICGKTVVKRIGLENIVQPQDTVRPPSARAESGARAVSSRDIVTLVDRPDFHCLTKSAFAHKYTSGHALILSGPPGAGGAARLAARGALRIGAGLVSVVCGDAAVPEHAARLDAVMIKPAEGPDDLTALLDDARFNALCIGPGLGHERARGLVPVALAAKRATVLDADALTVFADTSETLFNLLHENCILTPHGGEFKRLFPDIAETLNAPAVKGPAYSKVDATRQAARRAGCTVLFKGPDTVIADPDGNCFIHSARYDRAAPWLATAGSGDVLSGMMTGLLARGFAPVQAAKTAAWLHVEAAHRFGPGLIAEDLPEELPNVFRALAC
ncbi:MAG: NAD(P)H-hydrate dehydratase [Rhodobiaceae bacterium]|jgi:hydroxyethylthiazole kinase-like uncharacterized protein yjeF|nr:NAD(P)H-hydrate dehydratase [Rhodobiaceae bacterium]